MRATASKDGIKVNAIGGTHVILLGIDIEPEKRPGLLGFGIRRTDKHSGEQQWMRGSKTFPESAATTGPGQTFSSREQPFQGFQWSDYSAKPGYEYDYTVLPMYGSPTALTAGSEVTVSVKAEPEWGSPDSPHSVFFNRGSIATQEYARRFQNKAPKVVGQAAYDWLSRGLHEALLSFIERAVNEKWTVYGAVYEFQDPPVLAALAAAHARGARVSVIYDAIAGTGPKEENEKAIAAAHIGHLCKARTHGKIMHNKFFVLEEDGVPKAVLTGSTNLTENGIYGHSNVVHVVEDEAVARSYLAYWERLKADPQVLVGSTYKLSNDAEALALPEPPTVATVFSPRSSLEALDWYGSLASKAESGLFMTFAFGLNAVFQEVFGTDDEVLRFGLLEKRTAFTREPARAEDLARVHTIAARKNVVLAVGNRIVTNEFDRWLKEMARLDPQHGTHVQWIHDKFMLVDPLSDSPVVVTGSANFSAASTTDNDENMLVILGDKRVADIYLGEFMRLHSHYAFRQALQIHVENGGEADDWTPQFLVSTDEWQEPYFDSENSSGKYARRLFFAQDIA